jgi:hypothetical protein
LYWFGREILCVIGFGGELEEWVCLEGWWWFVLVW